MVEGWRHFCYCFCQSSKFYSTIRLHRLYMLKWYRKEGRFFSGFSHEDHKDTVKLSPEQCSKLAVNQQRLEAERQQLRQLGIIWRHLSRLHFATWPQRWSTHSFKLAKRKLVLLDTKIGLVESNIGSLIDFSTDLYIVFKCVKNLFKL